MSDITSRMANAQVSWLVVSMLWCISLTPMQAPGQPMVNGKGNNASNQNRTNQANGGLGLEECIQQGLANQPALGAAQASLSSAELGRRSLDNLGKLAEWLRKDLPIRRHQADLGIVIATAGLEQAYWETRYAVARNYYSYQFADLQHQLASDGLAYTSGLKDEIIEKRKKAKGETFPKSDVEKLEVAVELIKAKLFEASLGKEKARAALREAMGVPIDFPLALAKDNLPEVVENGIHKEEVIALACARRGELIQATNAKDLAGLEVEAQHRINGLRGLTFAAGADIHAKPIPPGWFNDIYRPSALGLEMPTQLIGKRGDRVDRAAALHARSESMVAKTHNLVALEASLAAFKWQEAVGKVKVLKPLQDKATQLAKLTNQGYRNRLPNANLDQWFIAHTMKLQAQTQLNEAMYLHALALVALERVTAGGIPLSARSRPAVNQLPPPMEEEENPLGIIIP